MSERKRTGPFDIVATVVAQEPAGSAAYRLTLNCPEIARCAKPPQFFTISCHALSQIHAGADADSVPLDPILRRPLGFYRVRPDKGEFDTIYQVVGRGTRMLTLLKPGDRVRVLGPLGKNINPKDIRSRTALLVGGGAGLPPLCYLSEALQDAGKEIIVIAGARHRELLIAPTVSRRLKRPVGGRKDVQSLEPLAQRDIDCAIALERPEEGFFEGLITAPLEEYLELDYEGGVEIVACGPPPMVRVIAKLAEKKSVKCTVVMESRMGCAIGACQTCVIATTGGYRRVCVEGPVFDAKDIVWE